RRHTRCYRDWSSDVCSSDLIEAEIAAQRAHVAEQRSGDELRSMRDSVIVLSDSRVRTQVRERDARPDQASRIPHLASRKLPNPQIGSASCRESSEMPGAPPP